MVKQRLDFEKWASTMKEEMYRATTEKDNARDNISPLPSSQNSNNVPSDYSPTTNA